MLFWINRVIALKYLGENFHQLKKQQPENHLLCFSVFCSLEQECREQHSNLVLPEYLSCGVKKAVAGAGEILES